jgi:hypothetical protein
MSQKQNISTKKLKTDPNPGQQTFLSQYPPQPEGQRNVILSPLFMQTLNIGPESITTIKKKLLWARTIFTNFPGGFKARLLRDLLERGKAKVTRRLRCSRLESKMIRSEIKAIRSARSLHTLELMFWRIHPNRIGVEDFHYLIQRTRTSPRLRKVTLDFGFCNTVEDANCICIYHGLKSLPFLRVLDFSLRGCTEITDNGFKYVSETFRKLGYLQSVSLHLEYCQGVTDNGYLRLSQALKTLSALTEFRINLTACNISDEGLGYLFQMLKFLYSLQKLTFLLPLTKISDNGCYYLGQGLLTLVSLKKFALIMNACDSVTDDGCDNLSKGLVELTSLEELTLNLGNDEVSEEGHQNLLSSLNKLRNLRILDYDSGMELYHIEDVNRGEIEGKKVEDVQKDEE